ncbi:hypothetical protein C8A05DRAFT_33300, partial [Staphylotrichum tortipilum]
MHDPPRDSAARTQVLALVQFHAVLATLLLAAAANGPIKGKNQHARPTAVVA